MVDLRVIKGGPWSDPDEIPAPDKPIEEWTEADHEEYEKALWDSADDPGSIEYVVKKLQEPIEAIETAVHVLEAIKTECEEEAAILGLISDYNRNNDYLLNLLRRRVKADKTVNQ